MTRPASSFVVTPGLLTALALQSYLTDTTCQRQQDRAGGQLRRGGAQPVLPVDRGSWQHNVTAFLGLLNTSLQSRNPYNDPAALTGVAVLSKGLTPSTYRLCYGPQPPAPSAYPLAPARGDWYVNESLVDHYALLLRVAGYDPAAPVLLDREGRILDGYHRLMACDRLGLRAPFVQLNY